MPMKITSPFAPRLGTNYAATDDETTQLLQDILPGPLTDLESLHRELNSASSRLIELQNQHGTLLQGIEEHRALIAPIRRLPIAVLRQIFLCCIPQSHDSIISRRECPVLLGQICSRWRHIAINTEALWASIHIPIPSDSHAGFLPPMSLPISQQKLQLSTAVAAAHRRALAISEWLGRSGSCILSISLYDPGSFTSPQIQDIILDALLPFARRWESLTCLTRSAVLDRIAALPSHSFPYLHTLSIPGNIRSFGYSSGQPSGFWIHSGIMGAPKLCRLSYKYVQEDFTLFPLHRAQLTSLSLSVIQLPVNAECTSPHEIAILLSACPLLQDCRIDLTNPKPLPGTTSESHCATPPASAMPNSIPLQHLSKFHVEAENTDISMLLDVLYVPTLEKLVYYSNCSETSPLPAFLRRVAHTLRALTINPNLFTPAEFLACMRACAGVIDLHLGEVETARCPRIPSLATIADGNSDGAESQRLDKTIEYTLILNDKVLRLFTPLDDNEESELLLPHLTTFACTAEPEFTDANLLKFLKARNRQRKGMARLKKVDITYYHPQEHPLKAELEEMEQDGLRCRLSYPTVSQRKFSSAWEGIRIVPGLLQLDRIQSGPTF